MLLGNSNNYKSVLELNIENKEHKIKMEVFIYIEREEI